MNINKKKAERLTFFCQLCDKSIDSNICQTHGIDFVTIKKVSESELLAQQAAEAAERKAEESRLEEEQRVNGMLQLEQRSGAVNSGKETRIALAGDQQSDDAADDTMLPVIPDAEDADQLAPSGMEEHFQREFNQNQNQYDYPDPQYEDVEAEPQPEPQPDYFDAPQQPEFQAQEPYFPPTEPAPSSNKGMIFGLLTALALVALAVAYFAMGESQTPTSLYSEAEQQFNQQNYAQALTLYNQFLVDFPNDALVSMVNKKISQINNLQASDNIGLSEEYQEEFKELMLKANIAFQKQQYIEPLDDNVISYLRDVLKMDAGYAPALEMQQKIVDHYDALANTAKESGAFDDAITYYRTILVIKPNDATILGKIHETLTQKGESAPQ